MTQASILSGIYSDAAPDLRQSYPVNMVPVPMESGVSGGYLRPGDGIVKAGDLTGIDRGGIWWKDAVYRVCGTDLVRIDEAGNIIVEGTITGTGRAVMVYSFDYLAICADGKLWLYNGVLTQVTDPDLGIALSVVWIDGYFVTTDGENIISTDLGDPFSINPLHYGSSEADPDPVVAVSRVRNELVALNRYTIETFNDIGGTGFPFQRVDGAFIPRGCVGTYANCRYLDSIAFAGGARNEPISIWVGGNGQAVKLATREIDKILKGYSDTEQAGIILESKADQGQEYLLVHLPDQCLAYDAIASQAMGAPVWFVLQSGWPYAGQYRARSHVFAWGTWQVADPQTAQFGRCTGDVSTHWGEKTVWTFGTALLYNGGAGCIIHELELVALTGRVTDEPLISTEYSLDGLTWSQPKSILAGLPGDRVKRLVWRQQGQVRNFRAQRFKGDSDAHLPFLRLETKVEALLW